MKVAILLAIIVIVVGIISLKGNKQTGGDTGHAINDAVASAASMKEIRYGDVFYLQTQSKYFLNTCGPTRTCPGNGAYNVVISRTPDGDQASGAFTFVSNKMGGAIGEKVRYGDKLHIKNLYAQGTYLDTCGKDPICGGLGVQTHVDPTRESADTATWKIINPADTTSSDAVNIFNKIYIQTQYDKSYLVACGNYTDCGNSVLGVTCRNYSGKSLADNGSFQIIPLVPQGKEYEAVSCCLGINTEGCEGFNINTCPPILKNYSDSTPEVVSMVSNSKIFTKYPELQDSLDKTMSQKCAEGGEWRDKKICSCFKYVDAAMSIPGYNPLCHNVDCVSGKGYKTRTQGKTKCPGSNLTICSQNMDLDDIGKAEMKQIKFVSNCGNAPQSTNVSPAAPSSTPTSATSPASSGPDQSSTSTTAESDSEESAGSSVATYIGIGALVVGTVGAIGAGAMLL